MPDVFVSYKKTDRDRVRPLVEHLRATGLDVWWDEGIAPSMSWRAEIAKQLDAAKCVVAVWTTASVDHEQGQWVMEEANDGLSRRILAPVRLDLVQPPLGFREVQFADLAAWSGGAEDPRLTHFIAVVKSIVAREPMAVGPTPTSFEAPGIKMSGVTMQNVSIKVVQRGEDDEEETEPEQPAAARARRAASGRPFSISGVITGAIAIIFPLVGVWMFVTQIGGIACQQGNAPQFFCQALADMQAANKRAAADAEARNSARPAP
jgi:TIR domain